jgi:uncharacterized protein
MQFNEAKKFILKKLKKELPKHLSYHSVEHITDVYNSAKAIAKHEKVKGEDLKLLLTAALFHDSGFLEGQKEHEKLSCSIAKEYLPAYDYNDEQINKICGMIMATKIPQAPKNLLEEIICDADLDYLGRNDFFIIGDRLFSELRMYGMINDETDWNRLQVRFLETHHYFTKTAIKLRKEKKDEYLAIIKSRLDEQKVVLN